MDEHDDVAQQEQEASTVLCSSSKEYTFDDLFTMVGGFGRYPALLYSFTCIMSIPIGLSQLVQVFYGATPMFECANNAALNDSCAVSRCCANCTSYDFKGVLTSAVSEVGLLSGLMFFCEFFEFQIVVYFVYY